MLTIIYSNNIGMYKVEGISPLLYTLLVAIPTAAVNIPVNILTDLWNMSVVLIRRSGIAGLKDTGIEMTDLRN